MIFFFQKKQASNHNKSQPITTNHSQSCVTIVRVLPSPFEVTNTNLWPVHSRQVSTVPGVPSTAIQIPPVLLHQASSIQDPVMSNSWSLLSFSNSITSRVTPYYRILGLQQMWKPDLSRSQMMTRWSRPSWWLEIWLDREQRIAPCYEMPWWSMPKHRTNGWSSCRHF